jgi:gamma-glutamyltranspeptidase/glutathione hydrolase
MAVLERGGTAFDAAVAGGFTLQVVEPHLNGLGGEVPIALRSAAEGEVRILCGQGVAPAGATIAPYRREGLDMVPGAGLLATVVPGAFDAWMQLLRDYGSLPPREVLKYAIGYARDGYPLVPMIRATIERVETLFREEWPSSAAVYLPGGKLPVAGRLFRNPALASTYERLLKAGEAAGGDREAQIEAMRRAWSQGFVAEALETFSRAEPLMDSSGARHRGVLAAQDLAAWQATYEAPLTYDFHGYTLCKGGPWSRCSCSSLPCSRASTWRRSIPPGPTSCTWSPRPPSSPSPTARPTTATRTS